jgi:Zn-dependent protease
MTPALQSALCAQCGAELPAAALSCPACASLVHAAELERLAFEAKAATTRGDLVQSHALWKQVLGLLPPGSMQYRSVDSRLAELEKALPAPAAVEQQKPMAKWATRLGPLGVFLWKFKMIGLLLASKAKLILLGLTKLGTITSMLVSAGVYWTWYGWKFALGLVLSIYIHEMGHVFELRRFGVAATTPVFIPGFGALIRLKQRPPTVGADARVGLAGPVWGLAAAFACLGMYWLTGAPIWAALTHFGAWINLFNLVPVWQLDGSRGFAALTRANRGFILATCLVMWFFTNDGMLVLVAIGSAYRLFTNDYPPASDAPVLRKFVALIVLLAILCLVGIPGKAQ